MNFITSLLSSKFKSVIYNVILIIINRFTKMIKYLFIKITIDIVTLTKIFYNEIMCHYNMLNDIVSDRDFIFINNF